MFYNGQINIQRQGNRTTWHSFTEEFQKWFNSNEPDKILNEKLAPMVQDTVKQAVDSKLKSLPVRKPKTISIQAVGLDGEFEKTLQRSLETNYIRQAAARRTMTDAE